MPLILTKGIKWWRRMTGSTFWRRFTHCTYLLLFFPPLFGLQVLLQLPASMAPPPLPPHIALLAWKWLPPSTTPFSTFWDTNKWAYFNSRGIRETYSYDWMKNKWCYCKMDSCTKISAYRFEKTEKTSLARKIFTARLIFLSFLVVGYIFSA